jgi:hypothetical protein
MKVSIAAAFAGLLLLTAGTASAASFSPLAAPEVAPALERVQYRPYQRGSVGPRYYTAPRAFAPRVVGGGARYFAPRGYVGRPYWYSRPWGARPYYGTIIAGVALGTLVTVAAIGYAPRRPASNLCWYWADPEGSRGYWDYCA